MLLMFASSCSDSKDDLLPAKDDGAVTCTELIYCHPDEVEATRKVVEYTLDKINAAQAGLPFRVNLNFEYADDAADRFDIQASSYLVSGKYGTIIAPSNAEKALSLLNVSKKCFENDMSRACGIILPSMTSNEVQRVASSKRYAYCLSNDDRQLFGLAFHHMRSFSKKYVNLVCTDDAYGHTFSRFFSLNASMAGYTWVGDGSENGKANGLIQVKPDISREEFIKTLTTLRENFGKTLQNKQELDEYANYIVASSNPEHGVIVDSLVEKWSAEATSPNYDKDMPHVIIIDPEHDLKYNKQYNKVFTYSMSPDPNHKDFAEDFKSHFGYYPVHGEAFVYDAILLAFYTEYNRMLCNQSASNERKASGGEALDFVTKGKDEVGASWNSDGIRNALQGYLANKDCNVCGVTSDWSESNSTYYGVLYINKKLDFYNHMVPVAWFHNDSESSYQVYSNRMKNWQDGWQAEKGFIDNILFGQSTKQLPQLDQRWALLIASDKSAELGEWYANYRHQGDVWYMYNLLRNRGYEKNHIIVVTEDDIFGHGLFGESAGEKVVKAPRAADNVNLYEAVEAHYKLSDLTQQDIIDIMAGKESEKLPYVIKSTSSDNVFVYWSSHGEKEGFLRWDGQGDPGVKRSGKCKFTSDMLSQAFKSMEKNEDGSASRYRRMFFVLEACHSGKIISKMPQLDNVLYLSAAEDEPSYATGKNAIKIDYNQFVHVFDDFTANFVSTLKQNPDISMYSLFNRLYDNTSDSHVFTFNSAKYGNLHQMTFCGDFIE